MSREEMINQIFNSTPPFDKNDIYYLRDDWQKYGGVSSGISVGWCWFKSVRDLPEEELTELYNKVTIK